MCFVWIWEQTAIISLYSIDWLVFITETECVYCAVRTDGTKFFRLTFPSYLPAFQYLTVYWMPVWRDCSVRFPKRLMSFCKCKEFCRALPDPRKFESLYRHLNAHVSWKSCDFSPVTVSQCWHSSHCSHKLCISLLLTNNINNRDSILVTCEVTVSEFSLVSVSNACLVYLHAATEGDFVIEWNAKNFTNFFTARVWVNVPVYIAA